MCVEKSHKVPFADGPWEKIRRMQRKLSEFSFLLICTYTRICALTVCARAVNVLDPMFKMIAVDYIDQAHLHLRLRLLWALICRISRFDSGETDNRHLGGGQHLEWTNDDERDLAVELTQVKGQ